MKLPQKIAVYLTGVILGVLVLWIISPGFAPRRIGQPRSAHPWHNQTAPNGYYPLAHRDSYGRLVELPTQPRYYASLAPSVTECLFAMGLGDHLVGVTRWCQYPPEASRLTSVGDINAPSTEILIGLRADLVIGSNLTPRTIFEQLTSAGLRTVSLSFDDFPRSLESIRILGKLIGIPSAALRLEREMQTRMDAVKARALRRTGVPPRVVLLYDLERLPSAGRGSWPGDLLEFCGAINLAASAPSPWPCLSLEGIVSGNPDYILVACGDNLETGKLLQMRIASLAQDGVWRNITAVQRNQVRLVPEGPLTIPGPRMVEAAESIAHALDLP